MQVDFQREFAVILRLDVPVAGPKFTLESVRATGGLVRISGGQTAPHEYHSADRWIFEGRIIPKRAAGETVVHSTQRITLHRAYGIWVVPNGAYHAGDEVEVVSTFGRPIASTTLR